MLPLLPLLACIMLDPLDKELEKRDHQLARYADDFTILVKSPHTGDRVLSRISIFLSHRLKLVVNKIKIHVVKNSESKFLGFKFNRGRIQSHPKTLLKFNQQVRRLTNSNWGVSMHYQLFKISQYLRGWINYFGIVNCYQRCVGLDHWIRLRVRMACWREWRKPRTKVRSLMRLGRSDAQVHVQDAVACDITSKGPWRSAKTPETNQALSLDWSQGFTHYVMVELRLTILSETPCAESTGPTSRCRVFWKLRVRDPWLPD
jgi:RNA-directed DNA polymerase